MKPRYYTILERAVEEGALRGYIRAFKHDENPSEDRVVENIRAAIMNEIAEYFTFDEL